MDFNTENKNSKFKNDENDKYFNQTDNINLIANKFFHPIIYNRI